MSKKRFTGSGFNINHILGDLPEETPVKKPLDATKPGEVRATFIVNKEALEKLKAVAYWDRLLIKDVINTALEEAIARYEKKNGVINPIPKKK